MNRYKEPWLNTPNDGQFAVYSTSQGLEIVFYCDGQRWVAPQKEVSVLTLGALLRTDSTVWGKA